MRCDSLKLRFQVVTIVLASALCAAAAAKDARLKARPTKPSEACVPGLHPLGFGEDRGGQFFIPAAAASGKRLPLIVFLHGAARDSREGLRAMQDNAEREGFLLLVPESRGTTWDAISGSFGPDVGFIDRALEQVFRQCAVDGRHITLAGFSDGASYALSLGLANGDLFSRIIAFSPGFIVPTERFGMPWIFIAHGTRDRILPIDKTSRRFVQSLENAGYSVRYREFDGPHAIVREVVEQALRWVR